MEVYADFEALVKQTDLDHPTRGHKSFDYETQTPCSVGYKVISLIPELEGDYQSYVGEDCVEWFLQQMFDLQQKAFAIYFDDKRFIRNIYSEMCFRVATSCHICHKQFLPDNSDKVRDHDHVTGEFRGAAHNNCNLALRRTCRIPIFFHNFRGYDSHFITKALNKFGGEEIRVIGQGMEKYLTITLGKHIVFKDSLQFMGASLQTLGSNLLKAGFEKFVHLKKEWANTPDDQLRLLVRKGVYPYEYMDSMEKFDDDHLPPKDAFFSKLHNQDITDEEYAHAQNVWRTFNIRNMREYHDLYLKSMPSPKPLPSHLFFFPADQLCLIGNQNDCLVLA